MRHRIGSWIGWLLAIVVAVGIYDLRDELGADMAQPDAALSVDAVEMDAGSTGEELFAEYAGENLSFWDVDSPPASLSDDRYVYGTLDDECRHVYDEIYEAISVHADTVQVSTTDADVIERAYRALMADHGEIFWVSGYSYTRYTRGEDVVGMEFMPGYTKTQEERENLQEEIDAKVNGVLSGISPEASDYEKAKYVFDYLACNVAYRVGAPENQNILSVFLYGETVCQGYASAMQYLLTRLGLLSAIVTGEADGTPHAWNLVCMDGEYYYMDPTWGASGNTDENMERYADHSYFGVTTEDIGKSHVASDHFALPDCIAWENNYFVREGLYFAQWDPDTVGGRCAVGFEQGDVALAVRFSTEELRQQAVQYLIHEAHIVDYCEGLTQLYYVEDEWLNVVIFRFR